MLCPPLYEHQKEAVEKMHNGCILCGGVGSGKSRAALAYFVKVVCRRGTCWRPIYVITTARKRDDLDWQGEAAYFGISTHYPEVGYTPLVVDSWNNIKKYIGVKDAFFIFDENRVVGYGAWVKSFLKITRQNQWVVLSATPGDCWMDYLPVFMANGFYRTKTEFTSRHVVYSRFTTYPRIERYINSDELIRNKGRVLVYMPFVRATESHVQVVKCEYDKGSFMRVFRGRWNIFEKRPVTSSGEWCYLMRKVVNSERERLEKLLDIYEGCSCGRLIVFYNYDYELEILKDGLGEYLMGKDVVLAEYNGHRHDEVPESERWIYLVNYMAASEAWNCVSTDSMVFYSLNYSYKMMEQSAGRINRANTKFRDLWYYVLVTDSPIDKSILVALKNKKKFNENRFFTRNCKEIVSDGLYEER